MATTLDYLAGFSLLFMFSVKAAKVICVLGVGLGVTWLLFRVLKSWGVGGEGGEHRPRPRESRTSSCSTAKRSTDLEGEKRREKHLKDTSPHSSAAITTNGKSVYGASDHLREIPTSLEMGCIASQTLDEWTPASLLSGNVSHSTRQGEQQQYTRRRIVTTADDLYHDGHVADYSRLCDLEYSVLKCGTSKNGHAVATISARAPCEPRLGVAVTARQSSTFGKISHDSLEDFLNGSPTKGNVPGHEETLVVTASSSASANASVTASASTSPSLSADQSSRNSKHLAIAVEDSIAHLSSDDIDSLRLSGPEGSCTSFTNDKGVDSNANRVSHVVDSAAGFYELVSDVKEQSVIPGSEIQYTAADALEDSLPRSSESLSNSINMTGEAGSPSDDSRLPSATGASMSSAKSRPSLSPVQSRLECAESLHCLFAESDLPYSSATSNSGSDSSLSPESNKDGGNRCLEDELTDSDSGSCEETFKFHQIGPAVDPNTWASSEDRFNSPIPGFHINSAFLPDTDTTLNDCAENTSCTAPLECDVSSYSNNISGGLDASTSTLCNQSNDNPYFSRSGLLLKEEVVAETTVEVSSAPISIPATTCEQISGTPTSSLTTSSVPNTVLVDLHSTETGPTPTLSDDDLLLGFSTTQDRLADSGFLSISTGNLSAGAYDDEGMDALENGKSNSSSRRQSESPIPHDVLDTEEDACDITLTLSPSAKITDSAHGTINGFVDSESKISRKSSVNCSSAVRPSDAHSLVDQPDSPGVSYTDRNVTRDDSFDVDSPRSYAHENNQFNFPNPHLRLSIDPRLARVDSAPCRTPPLLSTGLDSPTSDLIRTPPLFSSPLHAPSPILLRRSINHSRASSITSADFDLMAAPTTINYDTNEGMSTVEKIEALENQVHSVNVELGAIESDWKSLEDIDPAGYYVNVDGLKKVAKAVGCYGTSVSMTKGEIARAFDIVRRYRYGEFGGDTAETASKRDGNNLSYSRTSKDSVLTRQGVPGTGPMRRRSHGSHVSKQLSLAGSIGVSIDDRAASDDEYITGALSSGWADSGDVELTGSLPTRRGPLPAVHSSQLEVTRGRRSSNKRGKRSRSSNVECATGTVLSVSREIVTENVMLVEDIIEYSVREWKGDTSKAVSIQRGYRSLVEEHCFAGLCRVRGDNYCAVRSALCALWMAGRGLDMNHLDSSILELAGFVSSCPYLRQWSFGDLETDQSLDILMNMKECLLHLRNVSNDMTICASSTRKLEILAAFNSSRLGDLRLMEAVKLLMMSKAHSLHTTMVSGGEVPVFAMLLFARDNCSNPEEFYKNYLSSVGQSGGLEQVEMCLLGYSLGVVIQVFRLSQHGQSEFIALYPEDSGSKDSGTTPSSISLVAEDDRHYNALYM